MDLSNRLDIHISTDITNMSSIQYSWMLHKQYGPKVILDEIGLYIISITLIVRE